MFLWISKWLFVVGGLFAVTTVPVLTQKGSKKDFRFCERINQDNLEVKSIMGADVIFNCKVMGVSEANITWTKDEKPLKDVSYRTFAPGSLDKVFVIKLKKVLVADGGKYKCTISSKSNKPITTSWKLIVREELHTEPPVIKEFYPINPKVHIGDKVKFFCSVKFVKVEFTPFIKWVKYTTYNETKQKPATPNITNTATTMQPVARESCQEKTLSLERFVNTTDVINGVVHEITDMKLSQGYESELVIHSATQKDGGEYSCVAFSEIGFHRKTSRLIVTPVPPLSKEELERRYVQKYGHPLKLPFSLAAVVLIPVCLLIILIIGCVWWHSNEQRLEEDKLKLQKQMGVVDVVAEEKFRPRPVIPIVSIQSASSESGGGTSYDFIKSRKPNSDAGVQTPVISRKDEPVVLKRVIPSHSTAAKSANVNGTDDKAHLLVEDKYDEQEGSVTNQQQSDSSTTRGKNSV